MCLDLGTSVHVECPDKSETSHISHILFSFLKSSLNYISCLNIILDGGNRIETIFSEFVSYEEETHIRTHFR